MSASELPAEVPAAEVEATAVPADVVQTPAAPDRTVARLLTAILVFVTICACALGEAVIVPILVAVLLSLLLAPIVRGLEHVHVPRAIGTLFVLTLTIAVATAVIAGLAAPAKQWVARMPQAISHIQEVVRDLRRPLQAATQASQQLAQMTNPDGAANPMRVDSGPGPLANILSATPAVLASTIATIFLTFVFLLHSDALLRKFVNIAPHWHAKRELVSATRTAQRELSRYVITITLINGALGLATAGALALMHVPDPLLWGGFAAIMNFAPYVGPLLTAVALAGVGFAQFPQPLAALAVPGAFLGLHLIEGQLITPHLVGRRLALDPVMVFVALLLLGWLWGVAGLLLAVPLMTCAKIVAERTEHGETVAKLLSVNPP